jgi:hypothetical protein
VIDPGNPRVKFTDPYPYPYISVPVKKGTGIEGVRVECITDTTDTTAGTYVATL